MIRVIQRDELIQKYQAFEKFLVLDVMDLASHEKAHLPQSIHIPGATLEKRAHALVPDRGTELVIHDNGAAKDAWSAANLLHGLGYYNLYVYEGGRSDWIQAGLSTEVHVAQSPAQAYNPTYPLMAA